MADERTLRLANEFDEISRIHEFVQAHCKQHALEQAMSHHLMLVVEELFSNIVKYGHDDDGRHEITVRLRQEADRVVIEIEDDGRAFNPLTLPEPDIEASVEDRRVGGLGIHLVRRLMDHITYERRGAANRLTLSKRLPQ